MMSSSNNYKWRRWCRQWNAVSRVSNGKGKTEKNAWKEDARTYKAVRHHW